MCKHMCRPNWIELNWNDKVSSSKTSTSYFDDARENERTSERACVCVIRITCVILMNIWIIFVAVDIIITVNMEKGQKFSWIEARQWLSSSLMCAESVSCSIRNSAAASMIENSTMILFEESAPVYRGISSFECVIIRFIRPWILEEYLSF